MTITVPNRVAEPVDEALEAKRSLLDVSLHFVKRQPLGTC